MAAVSKTGIGLWSAGTSRPISVQPKMTPSAPLLRQFLNHADIPCARRFAEGAQTQLIKNNLVNARPVGLFGDQAFNPELAVQPPAVKILLDGVARPQQRHARHAGGTYGTPGGIRDM